MKKYKLNTTCDDWKAVVGCQPHHPQWLLKEQYSQTPPFLNAPKYIGRKDFNLSVKKKPEALAVFESHGIPLNGPVNPNSLPVTHCCNTKLAEDGELVFPWELYGGARNVRFDKKCQELGLNYGVVTAVYGMGVSWEKSPAYHIESLKPRPETELWIAGGMIAHRCAELGIEHIHYVASPPSTMVPAIISLFASGVNFSVGTNNKSLEQLKQNF